MHAIALTTFRWRKLAHGDTRHVISMQLRMEGAFAARLCPKLASLPLVEEHYAMQNLSLASIPSIYIHISYFILPMPAEHFTPPEICISIMIILSSRDTRFDESVFENKQITKRQLSFDIADFVSVFNYLP